MRLTETTKKVAYEKLKRQWQYHLMLLPGVILIFIFAYIPLYGVIIAFEDCNPHLDLPLWVGMKHFQYIFSQPAFLRTIWNTFFIAVMKLIGGIVVPVIFALLLNELVSNRLKRIFQTLIYIPNFLSWVIMAGVLMDILANNGIINQFLGFFGMDAVNFLGNASVFPWTMIVTDIWKGFGFGTVVYLAALTSIDPGLYESAILDGATRWQQIRYITLPLLMPTIILMLVLALGNVLNAGFDQIFNLYSPIVYQTGDIIDTYVYRLGIQQAQYSVGAAIGLFKSAVSAVLVLTSYILGINVRDTRFLGGRKMQYKTRANRIFHFVNIFILAVVSSCVLPFINLLAISFSDSAAVAAGAVGFTPVDFTLSAYEYALKGGKFIRALFISFERVFLGVGLNLILMVLTAYPLSKTRKKVAGRNIYMVYFVITMLVSGGMIPTYLVVTGLGLKDTIWALILPGALPVYNMVILMNFMRGIPEEIEEAAAIDGASPFQILTRVLLPILKPALATVGLFCIVTHWNDWFSGMIYMNNPDNYPLQTYLQSLLQNFEQLLRTQSSQDIQALLAQMDARTGRAAQLFLGAIPVMVIYPFLQKYFTKGLVRGSVKG